MGAVWAVGGEGKIVAVPVLLVPAFDSSWKVSTAVFVVVENCHHSSVLEDSSLKENRFVIVWVPDPN